MSLVEVLDVDAGRLPAKCAPAVGYMEREWIAQGRPDTAQGLAKFLDRALPFCRTVDFEYPKIFLKRLKQLQRGEWAPRGQFRTEQ